MVSSIWYRVFKWFGLLLVLQSNPRSLFGIFVSFGGRSRDSGELTMIRHYVFWSIWIFNNDIFFSGSSSNVKDVYILVSMWIILYFFYLA